MNNNTKAYIAIAFLSIAWGTTYLAIRIAVMHYPAFLFAGLRQVIAGTLMAVFAIAVYKKADISRRTILMNMMIGFFMITVGNGIVSYSEKTVPSGVAALICSMMPLNAVMLNIFMVRDDKVNPMIVTGLLLAMGGVALIFRDNLADLANPVYFWGMIAIFIGTMSWAFGSIKSKQLAGVKNPIFNAAMQLFFGGFFLLLLSPAIDSYDNFEPFQPDALKAMAYLIIVGSFLAFTAYMFALKVLPVGIVTLYAYVNPLVAVILGYFIMGERLTWFTGLSFAGIVSGVYLVNAGYRKQKQKMAQAAALQPEIAVAE
ncbi:MAG: EamA family transporter [Chitinophagaceae bacterium]|nr:EamA family transporter [Chitinophagaceae bacterium]